MSHSPIDRITLNVAIAGALLAVGAYLLGGATMAVGAAVGGAVAVVNFVALRWLVGRIVHGPDAKKGSATMMLLAKLGVVGVVCWFLIVELGVDAVGFAIGLGALLIGITLGSGRLVAAMSEEG